jgi:hypothetical protein
MGVIVQFNYTLFGQLYPELAYLTQPQATNYFSTATTVHRNDGGGPVNDPTQQLSLLNMLTAHIAALFAPPATGGSATSLVGRISNAAEGSVSVAAAYSSNVSQQMAWFIQTKYGALYWTVTAPYRTMRYRPNRNPGVTNGFPFRTPPGFGV